MELVTVFDLNLWSLSLSFPSSRSPDLSLSHKVTNTQIHLNQSVKVRLLTHTCTHTHTYIHTNTCMNTQACTYKHIHVSTHMHTHTHIHTHTHTCTHTDTHTHTCTHTHRHTHKHTHTHSDLNTNRCLTGFPNCQWHCRLGVCTL